MSEKKNNDELSEHPAPAKKPYEKPSVESESLLAFGALCNNTLSGGRKESTGGPNNCNATKLLS